MSRISFENYGKRARELSQDTQIAGRYQNQADAERYIFFDIVKKLKIKPTDSILDIGCGTGNVTFPLSFICQQITCVDHTDVLNRMKVRFGAMNNLQLIPGNFLNLKIRKKFDKILSYSVLHYLSNFDEVIAFIEKSRKLLKPGGIALFGDIPNSSLKKRFLDTDYGKKFLEEWNRKQSKSTSPEVELNEDPQTVVFDDETITKLLVHNRLNGYNSYILPQSRKLPFGNTREDLLIIHPEQEYPDTPLAK